MTDKLDKLAATLGRGLIQHRLKLTTAESCTGGGLSYWLTSQAGSSTWFSCGFVTYSNASKIAMLNVNPATLETYGAVSKETAYEMAEGALLKSNADVSLAITGIAGPTGGSIEKPVGTVWFAWSFKRSNTETYSTVFSGDRQTVRLCAIETALMKLLASLERFS